MNTTHEAAQINYRRPLQQKGFTLVEIMVAITIGMLMMAGILQITLANKESSRLQRNMGFVQENMRSAMEILGRDIRLAGHYIDDKTDARILVEDAPAPFLNVVRPLATDDITLPVTADGGTNLNDQITLTREADKDCLGQDTPEVDGNNFAINHYFIKNERLMCEGNSGGEQPLVDGVESLQILYGIHTEGDPRSANRYISANQVADMKDVISVRIAMRFHSREGVRQTDSNDQYALLDADASPAPTDRRLRREMTTTIYLRNNGQQ